MADALSWLNLLLVPTFGLVWQISHTLARLDAVQSEHARRLTQLEAAR